MKISKAYAGAILALVAVFRSTLPATAADEMKRFNIDPQSLASALNEFASQSDRRIFFSTAVVGSKHTQGIKGELKPEDALKQLLRGSGLSYRVSGQTILVERTPPGSSADLQAPMTATHLAQAPSGLADEAQTVTDGTPGGEPGAPVQLQEVVVTAQKKEERLQDVPVPVTVISAPALATNNQLRIQDFYTSVPGLSVSPANQSTQLLSIRGITTGGVTNPTVGVTVDDVPYGASTNVGGALVVPDIDPGDLVRVEVLRGPQGTLYGASSMGGLLKFVTVDPSTDATTGRVEAGVDGVHNGNDPGYSVRGSVNVPLGDVFAIRASAFTHLDPGYIDNPVLGMEGVNEERVTGGRLSGLWRPSATFSLKLNAMFQDARGDGSNVVEFPTAGYPQSQGLGELQQNDLRGTGAYDRKVQAYSATVKAKLGSVDVTAISGYNINQFNDSFDYTYAFGPYARALLQQPGTAILNASRTNKFTEEVRLDIPLGEHVDWLLGGFYAHEKSIFAENIVAVDPATAAVAGTLLYVPIPTRYEEYAGFTDFTFRLTDRFDVQIGARQSAIRQRFSETESGAFFGSTPVVIPNVATNASAFTYLATPRYRITPDIMVYARLASGYRAGGSNPLPGSGTPPQYSPDKTRDYDLGLKGDFLEHRLSVDASLYYIDWQDIQLQLFNQNTGGDYNTNGSRAKSQGVELSLQGRPLEGLTASAWVTWDEAALKQDFPPGSTAMGATGDPLPNTARFSGNLSLDDEFPLGADFSGFVGGSVGYVGRRQGVFTASPQRQYFPAYAKTDLHTGARYAAWTATVYVNNVADKRGLISGGLGVFPPFGFYIVQPRTVGLTVSRKF